MKRTLALMLALAFLMLCTVPFAGAAEGTWICPVCGRENEKNFCPNDASPRPSEETAAQPSGEDEALPVKPGDSVFFGTYPQGANGETAPIEWTVLNTGSGEALLISLYGLDARPFNETSGSVTWETCTLRSWLNGTFLNEAFTADEQSALICTELDNRNTGNDGWSTDGCADTRDYVFLLSAKDAQNYFGAYFDNEKENTPGKMKATAYAAANGASVSQKAFLPDGSGASWWWLRSPGPEKNSAADINTFGSMNYGLVATESGCVRPAIRVNPDMLTAFSETETEPAETPAAEETQPAEVPAAEEAQPAETPAPAQQDDPEGPTVSEYLYAPTPDDLLFAVCEALYDGMDPNAAAAETYAIAEEYDITDAFIRCLANSLCYGTDSYYALSEGRYERALNMPWDYEELAGKNGAFYGFTSGIPEEMKEQLMKMFSVKKPQFNANPAFWAISDFKAVYKKGVKEFKPSDPQPGYALVIVKDSSEASPGVSWENASDNTFTDALETTIGDFIEDLGEDCPVITGNPNLASIYLTFELTYPFHGNYGSKGDTQYVKGYNCKVEFSVSDAKTGVVLAKDTRTEKLPDTISHWSNWIAKADTPVLRECRDYPKMVEQTRTRLRADRSAAKANRPITVLNAETVINGILAEEASKTNDAWQKAVYRAGARDVVYADGVLTFNLRSFDPKLKTIDKNTGEEGEAGFLMRALSNACDYDLAVTADVVDGQITSKSRNALKQAVNKAASAAKNAFAGRDMTAALGEYLFPVPVEGKLADNGQLLSPAESFLETAAVRASGLAGQDAALLFYAQRSRSFNANKGPHEIVINCVGPDPAALLKDTCKEMLDALAFMPVEERPEDDFTVRFEERLLAQCTNAKARTANKYTVTIDIDALAAGEMPADYLAYLWKFEVNDTLAKLRGTSELLLDIPAVKMPNTGRLSGSTSGTQCTFKLSKDSGATYIQMRSADTGEVAVSCFCAPGRSVNVRVPSGKYIICWASGPYWYGEEQLFGRLGSMNKTEATEILGKNYSHTFTLERSEDGDVGYRSADLSDFR